MSDDTSRHYLRFLALAAAVAVLVAVVGWLPTRRLAGAEGLTALLVACALCWLASALGGVPILLAARERAEENGGPGPGRPPGNPLSAVLGASLVRFVAVVGLAVAVVLSGLVAPAPLLLWTALGYLALLAVDTRYALRATTDGRADERMPRTLNGTDD